MKNICIFLSVLLLAFTPAALFSEETSKEDNVVETIGDTKVRVSDLIGYHFSGDNYEGTVTDLEISRDGGLMHILVEFSDTEGEHYGAPGMFSLEKTSEGIRADLTLQELDRTSFEQVIAEAKVDTENGGMFASNLMNYEVTAGDGQILGKVEDIVIDLEDLHVFYFGVTAEEQLGQGEALYALPISLADFDVEKQQITTNITESELRNVQGFDPDNWPDEAYASFPSAGNLGAGEEETK